MTSHTDQNDSVVEKQPLPADNGHQEEITLVKPPKGDDTEHVHVVVSVHDEEDNNTPIPSYAIEPAYHNTVENKYKETTITVPHLVRKVPQEDLTPKPCTTFNQVIILSYVSFLFCLFIGALANKWAWRAKIQNGKGLYSLAQKWARRSVYASYCAICCGILLIIFIPLTALEII